jgi:chemotaxis protein methyltransferase CheR
MHNLVTDRSFNEFQVILCRNVMIYFNSQLQQRVHQLLYDSLAMFGYLGLGRGETIRFSLHEARYETVCVRERIYRKVA